MSLIQVFYRCHATLISSLTAAVGAASGSANLYANTAMGIICLVVFQFYNVSSKDKIISNQKRDKMLKQLQGQKETVLEELVALLSADYVERRRRRNNVMAASSKSMKSPGRGNSPDDEDEDEDEDEDVVMTQLAELERLNGKKAKLEKRIGKQQEQGRLTRLARSASARLSAAAADDDSFTGFASASDSEDEDGAVSRFVNRFVELQQEGPYKGCVGRVKSFTRATRQFTVVVSYPGHFRGKKVLCSEAGLQLAGKEKMLTAKRESMAANALSSSSSSSEGEGGQGGHHAQTRREWSNAMAPVGAGCLGVWDVVLTNLSQLEQPSSPSAARTGTSTSTSTSARNQPPPRQTPANSARSLLPPPKSPLLSPSSPSPSPSQRRKV